MAGGRCTESQSGGRKERGSCKQTLLGDVVSACLHPCPYETSLPGFRTLIVFTMPKTEDLFSLVKEQKRAKPQTLSPKPCVKEQKQAEREAKEKAEEEVPTNRVLGFWVQANTTKCPNLVLL